MESWKGFLPENAIVMARTGARAQAAPTPADSLLRFVGEGNPRARLMFVSEVSVDLAGKAGQLLDKMIEAMGLSRPEVYIANIVTSHTTGEAALPQLEPQPEPEPEIIVALGELAAQILLETTAPITRLRGDFHTYRGTKLMPTFHPSYLLENPSSKKEAWADLQAVARELGIDIPKRT